jgi:hypothetical protein
MSGNACCCFQRAAIFQKIGDARAAKRMSAHAGLGDAPLDHVEHVLAA